MTSSTKTDWLIPAGLLALVFVPIVAGTFRIVQLAGGAKITPDNARFFTAPTPVVLHIVTTVIYSVLGAFQCSPGFRRRRPGWHRAAGRILIPCGLVVALTGLWMTWFYAFPELDGRFVNATRLLVGSAMVVFLCLGFAAIRRREIPHHRAWMMRAYALALGAGTQVFTHLPWVVFPGIRRELTRTLFMGAGWAINLAVAEWLISRERARQSSGKPRLAFNAVSTDTGR